MNEKIIPQVIPMDAAVKAAGALLEMSGSEPERHRLTAEGVAGIENMHAPATTKVEYLLTAAHVKPGSFMNIQTPDHMDTPNNEAPPAMPDELVQEHLKVAQDAGSAPSSAARTWQDARTANMQRQLNYSSAHLPKMRNDCRTLPSSMTSMRWAWR
jgi:hypothetical protein